MKTHAIIILILVFSLISCREYRKELPFQKLNLEQKNKANENNEMQSEKKSVENHEVEVLKKETSRVIENITIDSIFSKLRKNQFVMK